MLSRIFWKASILLVFALILGGCATVNGRLTIFPQRGALVTLVHTCTDVAHVYADGHRDVIYVTGAAPYDVDLHPQYLSAGGREVHMTVQSVEGGKIVGTYVQTFRIGSRTRRETWLIGNDSGWGGGGARRTRCQ